jgi:hypothetical protein
MEAQIPEKEVRSPVSRVGSKVGSGQPMSPNARSHPSASRGDAEPESREQEQPAEQPNARSKQPEGGSAAVVGPED